MRLQRGQRAGTGIGGKDALWFERWNRACELIEVDRLVVRILQLNAVHL